MQVEQSVHTDASDFFFLKRTLISLNETVNWSSMEPAVIGTSRLVCDVERACESQLVIPPASHSDSLCPVRVCVCVCCLDSFFVFLPVVTVAPVPFGFKLQCPPFCPVCFQSPPPHHLHISPFSPLEKDYGSRALISTHSLPELCKSLASCPRSLHFKLLSLPLSPSFSFPGPLVSSLGPGDCVE